MVERRRMPPERKSIAHKFHITDSDGTEHKGYIHVGLYDDGAPGEVFIKMAKQGSATSGLLDGISILMSMSLQHGVPLATIVDKLSRMRFEPYGMTGNPDIKMTSSVLDYIARWLGGKFIKPEPQP